VPIFRGPVHRRRDGTFAIDLGDNERGLLRTLVDQLEELLSTDSPVLERLFPPPYGDDAERNEGYAALAHPELIEQRQSQLDVVRSSIDATSLDEEQLSAWMRSINDLRLVLGTILEVTDDGAEVHVDDDNAATYQAYEYLGYLLETIVTALSGD
jgi:Domain of unknown function (DUF2017)